MKVTALVAALGLTLAPAFALAQSSTTTTNQDDEAAATQTEEGAVPTDGGTGQAALPLLGAGAIPAGAVVVGGVVIVAGVAVGVVAATNNDSAVATSTQ